MIGTISMRGVRKVYRRHRQLGRLHTLKGALFHRQLRSAATVEEFVALDELDMQVSPGEAVAFIGPNGSGKSTALKLISGILRPNAGTVAVQGRVTALIELGAGFHPEITGRENVIINAMLLGLSRQEINQRLDEIVHFSGIGDFIDQPVKTYSSGMYVRLGFAVAVAVDPAVLLIDEVLAVGDAEFSLRSLDRLARMRRQGVTMVLVSHDLELVESFADRVIYLRQGRMIMEGSPGAVIARYQDDLAGGRSRAVATAASSPLPVPSPSTTPPCPDAPSPSDETAGSNRPKRWGNGKVRIEEIRTLSSGRAMKIIPSATDCTVCIRYRVLEPVDDFVFGIAWCQADGTSIAGHNTDLDGWRPLRLEGEGEVRCTYGSLQLAPGEYLLDVAVHARDGTPYDYWCAATSVQVTAAVAWPGIWAPPHRWQGEGPDWEPPPGSREVLAETTSRRK